MKYIKTTFVLILFLLIVACNSSQQPDGSSGEQTDHGTSQEEAKPDEGDTVEIGTAMPDSMTNPEELMYCCGNHSPSHCVAATGISQLESSNGCTGFTAQ